MAAVTVRFFAFERRAGQNPWLDLVRALAIVLVLARHGYVRLGATTEAAGPLHPLLVNGWIGVDLFFVLSGFLISRHLLAQGILEGRFDFGRYVLARALRILPSYLAVLALTATFAVADGDRQMLGWRVLYHLLFLQDYLPANINVVFWSLAVEEKFYLLAPAFVWLVASRRVPAQRAIILALALLLSPLFRAVDFARMVGPIDYSVFVFTLRMPFHACLEPLVGGCAVALLLRRREDASTHPHASTVVALAGLGLLAWIGSHDMMASIGWFDVVPQPMVTAVLGALLVLGAVLSAKVPLPGEAAIRIVARLSYAAYLVHFPLIAPVLAVAATTASPTLAFWTMYLGITAVAACALHVCVEQPFLRLKDRLGSAGKQSGPGQAGPLREVHAEGQRG